MAIHSSGDDRKKGVDRITRVNEILKREIADLVERRGLNEGSYLLSVTKVVCATNLKNASVYISLLGATDEQQREILDELLRHRAEIQRNMSKHVVLKYTPVLQFIFDRNVAEGDRVLQLLRDLEEQESENDPC